MEGPNGGEIIGAELVSLQEIDVNEIIILTGGLKARLHEDQYVQVYPVWREEEPTWGGNIPYDIFQSFLKDRSIDIIGIMQISRIDDGAHWRWAPAKACHNPPHNNPSYRWTLISSAILRSLKPRTSLNVIDEKANVVISEADTKRLGDLAKHIAIDLHQLNHAIVMMAEHLHNEIVSQGPRCSRYSHIRNLDLSAHVHGFFQAFSAARDHYAQFLAIQIGRKRVQGKEIDSLFKLLNAVEPSQLRHLKIIGLMEDRNLLEIGKGIHQHKGKCRLVYKSDTWLKYTNELRNRFAHSSPYGTMPEEDITEIYQPDCDSSIFLAKSFLEKGEGEFPPNSLRTINYLYQNICALFLLASDATGYDNTPPLVSL
ncbi:hypothetical protein [Leisingera caerulea]|uniref:Apea-like HEPN domain-containing protein n=1 Tax=Leisingera caerulea TaxID=506591 RepID=A0A9Q9M461_LEICA|nr:hypothetical protein [Leisingera caerulea]UWQ55089.1 hypothetical protein K3721_06020 [Leisingera caerulea]